MYDVASSDTSSWRSFSPKEMSGGIRPLHTASIWLSAKRSSIHQCRAKYYLCRARPKACRSKFRAYGCSRCLVSSAQCVASGLTTRSRWTATPPLNSSVRPKEVKSSLTRQERRHARFVEERRSRAEQKRSAIASQKLDRASKRRDRVNPSASAPSLREALFRIFGGPLVRLYYVFKRL